MHTLEEQQAYYRARAPEYDQWFERKGRYDRGEEGNRRWLDEVAYARAALDRFAPTGDVLELACGTGNWTGQLARHGDTVTAVDGSPEMLAIVRAKVDATNVTYHQADLFAWTPDRQYDVVFFGFWLSHVPQERFARFWYSVRLALRAGGRVFFVDSLPDPLSRPADHPGIDAGSDRQVRYLNDGRRFEIVKRYYSPERLAGELAELGWDASIGTSGDFFLIGNARPIGWQMLEG